MEGRVVSFGLNREKCQLDRFIGGKNFSYSLKKKLSKSQTKTQNTKLQNPESKFPPFLSLGPAHVLWVPPMKITFVKHAEDSPEGFKSQVLLSIPASQYFFQCSLKCLFLTSKIWKTDHLEGFWKTNPTPDWNVQADSTSSLHLATGRPWPRRSRFKGPHSALFSESPHFTIAMRRNRFPVSPTGQAQPRKECLY